MFYRNQIDLSYLSLLMESVFFSHVSDSSCCFKKKALFSAIDYQVCLNEKMTEERLNKR